MTDIITVSNLKKYYGEIKAVDDISFSVAEGSLFAFLGVNGAGKSTTINVLCSVLKKTEGTVMIDGINIDLDPQEVKKRIGIVFQGSVLDGRLTVYANLLAHFAFFFFYPTLMYQKYYSVRVKSQENCLFTLFLRKSGTANQNMHFYA